MDAGRALIALLVLVGCGGSATAVEPTPGPEPPCERVAPAIWPSDGVLGHREPVVVSFAEAVVGDGAWPLPGGLPEVRVEVDGARVAGVVRQRVDAGWSARDLAWEPVEALAPEAEVSVVVRGPCVEGSARLRTTSTGAAVELPERATFAIEADRVWPSSRLANVLPRWIRIEARPESGMSSFAGDDTCLGVVLAPEGGFAASPRFDLRARALPASDWLEGAVLRNPRITGAVAPDLQSLDGLRLQGEVDTRALELGCAALAGLGTPCGPCADGSGPHCVRVDVVGARAVRIDDVPDACRERSDEETP